MRRRRFPAWLLLVAFIGVPILEIYVLIQVGQVIGAWWTVLLLIADSVLGAWLVRREGRRAWRALQVALREGRMPSRELADGILVLVGGTLMVTPGFVTDVAGMIAILPVTRPLGRRLLAGFLGHRVILTGFGGAPGRTRESARRPGPEVVQGDVIDDERSDDG